MKLIFAKTIMQKIEEAIREAQREGKTVDEIQVTPAEARELYETVFTERTRPSQFVASFTTFMRDVSNGGVVLLGRKLGIEK